MQKTATEQKKKVLLNYVYATIIGALVVACAIVIALVNAKPSTPTENITPNESVPVATNTYVVPVKNATIAKDFSASELQFNNTLKQWEIHKAIDFVASDDLNVYSVSNGTVSNIYTNYLEGTVIEISHSNGLVSVYKSLNNETKVSVGDKVSAGQIIGTISETMAQELNTGAHLHFEMLLNGVKVNPNNYLDLGNK